MENRNITKASLIECYLDMTDKELSRYAHRDAALLDRCYTLSVEGRGGSMTVWDVSPSNLAARIDIWDKMEEGECILKRFCGTWTVIFRAYEVEYTDENGDTETDWIRQTDRIDWSEWDAD